ncbi:metallopeptidase TldD-related protein [Pseudomonas marginalis]|uniref:metallopeptidase TldD-related protein n=1 Tax=Pseudomonas marginalis TaxID=298 RepID=UPI0039A274D1
MFGVSLDIDDEGEPSQNTVLIESAVLSRYMQDALNALLINHPPTCNMPSYRYPA